MKIDQEGLSPAGQPGFARNDGFSFGARVTLTDTTPGGTTRFEILWVSHADHSAIETLAPSDDDDHVWSFLPEFGVTGPIRIRLTHSAGGVDTVETRVFGIPDRNGVVLPAPGERSDPNAVRGNETNPDVIARCERNWPTDENPSGNPFGWWLDMQRALTATLTRRFIDVDVATAEPLADHTQLGGEDESEPATFTAEENGALIVDGETLTVGQLLLPLWETRRSVCRVVAAGDSSHPWEIVEVYQDKLANSENMYRIRAGQEHQGRIFVRSRFGENTEACPVLNQQVVEESVSVGPGMMFVLVPTVDVDILLTMRDLGGPTRFHGWRVAIKMTDAGAVRLNLPDSQNIEIDSGEIDNFYEATLPSGAYREWVFNGPLAQWLMVGRFQPTIEG